MSKLNSHTDAELSTMLNQGDRKAFEIIYKRHAAELNKYARTLIASKEDCEEIIHDIFIKIWTAHESVNINAIRPYLFRCVKNKVLDYFRDNAKKEKYAEHYRLFSAIYESVDEADKNGEAIFQILENGIKNLPNKLQKIIMLRLHEDLSNEEIAERMQLTIRSVHTYNHHINLCLRSTFRECYRQD